MTTIRDPQTGDGLRVTSKGRACVDSVASGRISNVSLEKGNAYVSYCKKTIAASNVDEELFCLTSVSENKNLIVKKIVLSTDAVDMKVEIFIDGKVTSSGTSKITPINLNLNSGNAAKATAYDGANDDLAIIVDQTKEIQDIRLTANGLPSMEINFEEALIIPNNHNISMIVSSSAVGGKVRAAVYFFEQDK